MGSVHTGLCDLLNIEVPIVLAPFGPWDQVDLAAAVCGAGALGSVGTAVRPVPELHGQWQRLRELTDRPFAINHTGRPFNAEAFEATLEFGPAAISFHMGIPVDLIAAAHERGIVWMQTVGDVEAARGRHRRRRRRHRCPGNRSRRQCRMGDDDGVGPRRRRRRRRRSQSSPPAASPTVAASLLRWPWAPKGSASVLDSWPPPR